jgi:uncharacterized repeat protein (TIGR03803 family)
MSEMACFRHLSSGVMILGCRMLAPNKAFAVPNGFWLSTRGKEFMTHDRGLRSSGAPLLVIIVAVVSTLGAWAQNNYKVLYKFTGGADGGFPSASLVLDQAGNLYGTTTFGGNQGACALSPCGVVFKLAPGSDGRWKESVVYAFCPESTCSDGGNPYSNVIFDQAGNLYGTTNSGGIGAGVVYKLTRLNHGWKESVLYSFTGRHDGGNPTTGLIFDSSGDLYGTTGSGGAYQFGTVLKLTPQSRGAWTESVLYDFTNGDDGGEPTAGVISDSQGNLYGATLTGGKNQVGVIFKLSPAKKGIWQISVLHSFTGGRDGGFPNAASLVMDTTGNLYGTTSAGGAYEYGTVFKLTQSGGKWKETVLHSFANGADGAMPYSTVVFDSAGNLYGTTTQGGDLARCGGSGCGVVFKLSPNSIGGWKETTLHAFADDPGVEPLAGVILDSAGNLYGTTRGDGTTTFGSVFEITPY